MTLLQFQTALHELYQLDSAVPASTDEDWTVRTNLLQAAINLWNGEEGVMWRELWQHLSDASDGTKVTATNTSAYACPTNFRFPGGFVRTKDDGVNWHYWPVMDQPKSDLFKNAASPSINNFCWFTGNKNVGYTLNFSVNPTSGVTIDYPYYKDPFVPAVSADIMEMSDPYFAIYYSLSKLHENDGEGDRATLALSTAENRLKAMKFLNSKMPAFQENRVPDRDEENLTNTGFGF